MLYQTKQEARLNAALGLAIHEETTRNDAPTRENVRVVLKRRVVLKNGKTVLRTKHGASCGRARVLTLNPVREQFARPVQPRR